MKTQYIPVYASALHPMINIRRVIIAAAKNAAHLARTNEASGLLACVRRGILGITEAEFWRIWEPALRIEFAKRAARLARPCKNGPIGWDRAD